MSIGSHGGKTWVDEGALDYLIEKYGIKSMVDVGCGPGDMVELAQGRGLEAYGIDGDGVFRSLHWKTGQQRPLGQKAD